MNPQLTNTARGGVVVVTAATAVPANSGQPVSLRSLVNSRLTDKQKARIVGARVEVTGAAVTFSETAAGFSASPAQVVNRVTGDHYTEPALSFIDWYVRATGAAATFITIVVWHDDLTAVAPTVLG